MTKGAAREKLSSIKCVDINMQNHTETPSYLVLLCISSSYVNRLVLTHVLNQL